MISEDDPDYAADVGQIVVAAFRFERENDDELDVEEGTKLRVIERRDEWWYAETLDGAQEGLIPVSYVVSEEEYNRLSHEGEYDVDEVDLDDIPDAPHTEQLQEEDPRASSQAEEEEEGEGEEEAAEEEIGEPAAQPSQETAKVLEENEASDREYEDLASKFAALQERVMNVRLTIEEEEEEPQHQQAAPPPTPGEAEDMLRKSLDIPHTRPAPPSPAQAAAAFAMNQAMHSSERPPPSPAQAAAALQQAMPPPPSPSHAQEELERQAAAALKHAEEERRRLELAEEESQRRALELRRKREEEARLQQEAHEREMAERQRLYNLTHKQAQQEQQGKAAFTKAVEAAGNAVREDNAGHLIQAYELYTSTLEHFAKVLALNFRKPQHAKIVERMEGYLARMSILEPEICEGVWSDGKSRSGQPHVQRFKDRVSILVTMSEATGYDPLPTAEECRIQARFAESKGENREAFRKYNEALEYYMAFHKLMKKKGKPTPPEVMESMTKMLDTAEALKGKIS